MPSRERTLLGVGVPHQWSRADSRLLGGGIFDRPVGRFEPKPHPVVVSRPPQRDRGVSIHHLGIVQPGFNVGDKAGEADSVASVVVVVKDRVDLQDTMTSSGERPSA